MARFRFVDEEPVTTNEMPKEAPKRQESLSKKSRFRFVDEQPNYFVQSGKELGQQAPRSLVAGAAGGPGSVLQFLGLQPEATTQEENAIIDELERKKLPPGLALESSLFRNARLPTIEEAGNIIDQLFGIKPPETATGRYAKRIGENVGAAATTGPLRGPMLALAATAGAVGQSAEEAGLPPWAQVILEIGTLAKGSKAKTKITSKTPEINERFNKLRSLGYTEQDITLAKSALEDRGILKKMSSWNKAAENRFNESVKNTEKHIEDILEGSFPGLAAEGSAGFRQSAEQLFENLDDLAKNVVVEKPEVFVQNANKAIQRLKNTLANTPQEKEVIGILEQAINSAVPGRTADVYTRFYKGLNQIGKWGSPKEREHVFSIVKDAIKQTFREQGPQGKQLAKSLEDANESWIKYLRAEDVSELLKKAVTEEGSNFKKLSKLIENPSNYQTLEKGLGAEATKNLKLIADTASSIGDLSKAIKGAETKGLIGASKFLALMKGIFTGDLTALKGYVGAETAGRLATRWLTNPASQNRIKRGLNAIKDQKWNVFRTLAQEFEKEETVPKAQSK